MPHPRPPTLLLGLMLASCAKIGPPTLHMPEPLPTATSSFQPQATSTVPPPAPSPTNTEPPPLPTYTPLPTLPPDQALARVRSFMDGSPDCRLPCWWGVTVGVTPWREAVQSLGPIATAIELWQTTTIDEADGPHSISDYHVRYQVPGGPGAIAVTTRDDVVHDIVVTAESTSHQMAAHNVVATYGPPVLALLRTYDNPTPFGFPFMLLLFYPEQGFMVFYDLEGFRSGPNVVGCPADFAPALFIWSPHDSWAIEDIQTRVLGPDYYHPLLDISEVTTYTLDTLYSAFLQQRAGLCIETPATLWE